MPNNVSTGMLLRSVYLPLPMDEALRAYSYLTRLSKSELIRAFLNAGMSAMAQKIADAQNPEDVERIGKEYLGATNEFSDQLARKIARDVSRLKPLSPHESHAT